MFLMILCFHKFHDAMSVIILDLVSEIQYITLEFRSHLRNILTVFKYMNLFSPANLPLILSKIKKK